MRLLCEPIRGEEALVVGAVTKDGLDALWEPFPPCSGIHDDLIVCGGVRGEAAPTSECTTNVRERAAWLPYGGDFEPPGRWRTAPRAPCEAAR